MVWQAKNSSDMYKVISLIVRWFEISFGVDCERIKCKLKLVSVLRYILSMILSV